MARDNDLRLRIVLDAIDGASGKLKTVAGNIAKESGSITKGFDAAAAAGARFMARMQGVGDMATFAGQRMALAGGMILGASAMMLKAYMEQEEAENRLRVIYGDGADALVEYASAMQRQTRYGDEMILNAMAIGATYPRLRGEMEQATATALNMAEAYGMDVVQAMHLLGRASAGQYGMLSRYGILVDKTRVKVDGMAEVYRAIGEETRNVAFESSNASKSAAQLANSWSDVAESGGAALVPVLQAIAPPLTTLAETTQKLAESPFGRMLILATTALGALLAVVGPGLMIFGGLISTIMRLIEFGKLFAATSIKSAAALNIETAALMKNTIAFTQNGIAAKGAGGARGLGGAGAAATGGRAIRGVGAAAKAVGGAGAGALGLMGAAGAAGAGLVYIAGREVSRGYRDPREGQTRTQGAMSRYVEAFGPAAMGPAYGMMERASGGNIHQLFGATGSGRQQGGLVQSSGNDRRIQADINVTGIPSDVLTEAQARAIAQDAFRQVAAGAR